MSHIHLPHNHGQPLEALLHAMPEIADFQSLADIFKLLGDGTRLRLFWLLCHCEECVINLSAMMGMSSPAIAHHLKQLKDGDLIVSRRDGKEVYYKAADTPTVQLLHDALEDLMAITCPMKLP